MKRRRRRKRYIYTGSYYSPLEQINKILNLQLKQEKTNSQTYRGADP